MKFPAALIASALLGFADPSASAGERAAARLCAKPAVSKLTGIFLGIEEGDYAHWQMRTDKGEERSFFILKPDASVEKVTAKPTAFKGRKCRVTWKKSKENIPEAGGKIELEQILSVEWVK